MTPEEQPLPIIVECAAPSPLQKHYDDPAWMAEYYRCLATDWGIQYKNEIAAHRQTQEHDSQIIRAYAGEVSALIKRDASVQKQLRQTQEQLADRTTMRLAYKVKSEELEKENDSLHTQLDQARKIVNLYFSPWGAAKGAMWSEISGDSEFSAHKALQLIHEAFDSGALRAKPEVVSPERDELRSLRAQLKEQKAATLTQFGIQRAAQAQLERTKEVQAKLVAALKVVEPYHEDCYCDEDDGLDGKCLHCIISKALAEAAK